MRPSWLQGQCTESRPCSPSWSAAATKEQPGGPVQERSGRVRRGCVWVCGVCAVPSPISAQRAAESATLAPPLLTCQARECARGACCPRCKARAAAELCWCCCCGAGAGAGSCCARRAGCCPDCCCGLHEARGGDGQWSRERETAARAGVHVGGCSSTWCHRVQAAGCCMCAFRCLGLRGACRPDLRGSDAAAPRACPPGSDPRPTWLPAAS
jgi:hypothetical protein